MMVPPEFEHLATFFARGGNLILVCQGRAVQTESELSPLSSLGRSQADALRTTLKGACKNVNLVLSSIAHCTIETVTDPDWPAPVLVPELFLPPEETSMAQLEKSAFKRAKTGLTAATAIHESVREPLEAWMRTAVRAIDTEIGRAESSQTVVVAIQSVLSALLAMTLICDFHVPNVDDLTAIEDLNAAEAFVIHWEGRDWEDSGGMRAIRLNATALGLPN